MSFALGTYGFGSHAGAGSGEDIDAPTITAVSPTPSTAPGDPGGFDLNPDIASQTPIVLDITDVFPGVVFMSVVDVLTGVTVFRGSNFLGDYIVESMVDVITDGFELTILPLGGWTTEYVQLTIDAIDGAGNYTTSTLVWQLPVASAGSELEQPAETMTSAAAAVDRLALQFRDDTGLSLDSPFPAQAATATVMGETAALDVAARATGTDGDSDVLVIAFLAEVEAVEDLGWVLGVGRVTVVHVDPDTSTWASVAAAIAAGGTVLTATARGATGDMFPSSGIATAGLPPSWPDGLDDLVADFCAWIQLDGGRDGG